MTSRFLEWKPKDPEWFSDQGEQESLPQDIFDKAADFDGEFLVLSESPIPPGLSAMFRFCQSRLYTTIVHNLESQMTKTKHHDDDPESCLTNAEEKELAGLAYNVCIVTIDQMRSLQSVKEVIQRGSFLEMCY